MNETRDMQVKYSNELEISNQRLFISLGAGIIVLSFTLFQVFGMELVKFGKNSFLLLYLLLSISVIAGIISLISKSYYYGLRIKKEYGGINKFDNWMLSIAREIGDGLSVLQSLTFITAIIIASGTLLIIIVYYK